MSTKRRILPFAGLILSAMAMAMPSDAAYAQKMPAKLKEYKTEGAANYTPHNLYTLWYTTPVSARNVVDPWMDYSLPIGNGQLGAMVQGGISQDVLQFNEKTLWTGSATERGAYQNFGYLYMEDLNSKLFSVTNDRKAARNYVLSLDLQTAIAQATWTDASGKVTFTKQYIASEPDQCIAVHLTASRPGSISTRFYLSGTHGEQPSYNNGGGLFGGKLTTLTYNARMKVVPKGGTMTTDGSGVTVKGADEVLLLLSAGTDYDALAKSYVSGTERLASGIEARVEAAAAKGWTALCQRHVADYTTFFDRTQLQLDGAVNTMSTDKMIDSYASSTDKTMTRMLEQMYFTYGRYLLIASSRGVDLPANLQGIWNETNDPAWQCDMHSDINVEMNYWPAESTNLSELHNCYLNYICNMAMVQPQWRDYARDRAHQTTGWTIFTENNIFGHCTLWHNDYVEANAWYCSHLWQHYRYTLDKKFLREKALPVMISCCKFWLERLKLDSDGRYVCPDSWSPEHGPMHQVTAHAQQLVWNLFRSTLDAIGELPADALTEPAAFLADLKDKFSKFDNGLALETYNGNYGATWNGVNTGDTILREWKHTDYASGNGAEHNHRHMSHLMALFPLSEIAATSPYFQPAINSMKLRGDQSQGWSMGWKINLWARALNTDRAYAILHAALKHSHYYNINMTSAAGGVYYNLLDAHSPFQIDGNFGACSGITEMLLQSHTGVLQLLPALPEAWPKGSVRGLKAVGNFTVDETWADARATKVVLTSGSGGTCTLNYKGIDRAKVTDANGASVEVRNADANHMQFETTAGGVYTITF